MLVGNAGLGENSRRHMMRWAEHLKSTKLPNMLQKFCADDIYKVNETGLFYCARPDGSLGYKQATLSSSKKAMNRVTVLWCSNSSGTDKQKLLVTGIKG
jgi:hypothetical protein